MSKENDDQSKKPKEPIYTYNFVELENTGLEAVFQMLCEMVEAEITASRSARRENIQ